MKEPMRYFVNPYDVTREIAEPLFNVAPIVLLRPPELKVVPILSHHNLPSCANAHRSGLHIFYAILWLCGCKLLQLAFQFRIDQFEYVYNLDL